MNFKRHLALQERTRNLESMRSILDKVEAEKRELSRTEKAKVRAHEAEVERLDEQIATYDAGGDPYASLRDNDLHAAARARAARHGITTGKRSDGGVGLSVEHRIADHVAEQRGNFPGFTGDLDALNADEFNLARCVKGMVTGERADLTETERRAMSEGVAADGGFLLPSPLAAQVIDLARAKSQVMNAGARTVVMDNATLAILTMIRLSRELWEDATSAAHSIFEADLVQALSAKLDFAALRGSGVAPEPKGILNQTGVNLVDLGANGATPSSYSFLVDAIAAIRDHNGEPNAAIYASRTQTTLDKLADSTGQPLRQPESVGSLAKFISNQIPTNLSHGTANNTTEAYVADWSTVLIGVRPTLQVRVVPLQERYADNFQVGLLAYLRADVQLAHPQHTGVVTGIKP